MVRFVDEHNLCNIALQLQYYINNEHGEENIGGSGSTVTQTFPGGNHYRSQAIGEDDPCKDYRFRLPIRFF
jgi:hypothetical protein